MASSSQPAQPLYVVGHGDRAHQRHKGRNAANTCDYFTPLLKPTFHILDAGSGPGTISATLAPFVPDGRVVGIDNSEVVINKARQLPDLPANCSFDVADLTRLPFPDASFDVVHTSQTLVHIPDVAGALRELYRVCKPGGFLASKEGDFPALLLYPKPPALDLWHKVQTEIMERGGSHSTGGRQLLSWAMDAGFPASGMSLSTGGLIHYLDNRSEIDPFSDKVTEDEGFRKKALEYGLLVESDFDKIRAAWKEHRSHPGAVWVMPCSQLVAYKT